MSKKRRQLGEVLLDEGLVTYEQLEEAMSEQAAPGKSLGRVLIDLGFVVEQDLVSALAKQIGLPFVDLADYPVDPGRRGADLRRARASGYSALPIGYEDSKLVVAMSDPANVFALDDIRTITGLEIKAVVATRSDIHGAIARFHRLDQSVEDIVGAAAEEIRRARRSREDPRARRRRADRQARQPADHPGGQRARVATSTSSRKRRTSGSATGSTASSTRSCARRSRSSPGVISRLKIMSDINIAERRIPQDGRVGLVVGGKAIDLRVATLAHGLRREGRHPDPR